MKLNKEMLYKALNLIFLIVMIFGSVYLFVWNAEAIPLIDTNLQPFMEWTGNGFFWMSYGTILLLWGVLYFLSGDLFISYCVMEIVTLVFGIANRVTLEVRKQYVSIAELKILDEAAGVEVDWAAMFHPAWIILGLIGMVAGGLLWVLYYKKIRKQHKTGWKLLALRAAMVLTGVLIFTCLYITPPLDVILYETNPFLKTGDIVWLSQSVFNDSSQNSDEITLEEIEVVYDEYEEIIEPGEEKISKKKPNIIVIMSEAFWDMGYMQDSVEMSENPMEDFYALQEEGLSGQVAVSTYGGGTNTTEFEFLTGLSAGHFSGVSDWYGEFYDKEQESFVSYVKDLGYSTMAFHSYSGSFWSRDTGYANMGFDKFYAEDDFQNRGRWHGYISDMSLTQEIIDRFNEQKAANKEQPVFAFAVSVHNHVYDLKRASQASASMDRLDIRTAVLDETVDEETRADVNEYVNGMDKTIGAVEDLLDYFRDYEEDTIIVFFGDHAPSFATTVCQADESMEEGDYYRTPYLIWTNYENDYEELGDMNISYLSTALIDCLDWPRPQQYYMNKYLLETCPVNTNYERVEDIRKYAEAIQDSLLISYYVKENFEESPQALPFWSVDSHS